MVYSDVWMSEIPTKSENFWLSNKNVKNSHTILTFWSTLQNVRNSPDWSKYQKKGVKIVHHLIALILHSYITCNTVPTYIELNF